MNVAAKVLDPLMPYKIGAAIILAIVLIVAAYLGINKILSWKEAAEKNGATVVSQNATSKATEGITGELLTANNKGAEVEAAANEGRNTYGHKYRQAIAENPSATVWANGVVPIRMRDAARERREARDRLTSDAAGGESPRDSPSD